MSDRRIRTASSPIASGDEQFVSRLVAGSLHAFQISSTEATSTIDAATSSETRRSAGLAPVLSYTRTLTSVHSVSAADACSGTSITATTDKAWREVMTGSCGNVSEALTWPTVKSGRRCLNAPGGDLW